MLNSFKRFLGIDTSHFDNMYHNIKRKRFSLRQENPIKDYEGNQAASETDFQNADNGQAEKGKKEATDSHKQTSKKNDRQGDQHKNRIKPIKLQDWNNETRSNNQQQEKEKQKQNAHDQMTYVSTDLSVNRDYVEKTFGLPTNADIIIRDFTIATNPVTKAFVVYLEGLSDKTVINDTILKSLMQLTAMHEVASQGNILEIVKETLLPGNQVMGYEKWKDVISNVLMGTTALFVEGSEKALVIETKGWQQRSVGPPKSEQVIRGPYDAFTENLRTNTALIRLRLQTNALITEMLKVGQQSNTVVAMMYLKGIANPALIEHVKKRIKMLDTDVIIDSGMIEQLIEDEPSGMIPTVLSTERPDRVSSYLAEGHVALIINNSPFVLIVPVSFWGLLHTAEDAYIRWPFGTFLRYIRLISLLIAMLMPGIYIAVTNYHVEMIPTELMIAIAASREYVPFPVVVEVLLMEFAIELIREAGIRIPSIIGPTIGIVGALILGQAAVQAGIVSPLLVIVVAVTALASFSIPNYNLSFGVRVTRFLFLVAGAIYGFFGIALVGMVVLAYVASVKSFGLPVLAPIAPYSRSKDVINRAHLFNMEERPRHVAPLNGRKQSRLQRDWENKAEIAERQQNQKQDESQSGGERDDS
jgi:spore germination protein KA